MSMKCPKCDRSFSTGFECVDCSVPLTPKGEASPGQANASPKWQQKPIGRLIIGLFIAQGAAFGFRLAIDAGVSGADANSAFWSTPTGMAFIHGVQIAGLFFACLLAGASQRHGLVLGAFVGLVNSLILLAIHVGRDGMPDETMLYGQTAVHVVAGALGGLIGSLVWRPLPVLELAKAPKKDERRKSSRPSLFAGPVAWTRVILGSSFAVIGIASARMVFRWLLVNSEGKLQIESYFQSQIMVWQLAGLAVVIGGVIAAMSSFNGLKQGLIVGITAGILAACWQWSDPKATQEQIVGAALMMLGLGVAGGWFGCKLFPPVARSRRRFAGLHH